MNKKFFALIPSLMLLAACSGSPNQPGLNKVSAQTSTQASTSTSTQAAAASGRTRRPRTPAPDSTQGSGTPAIGGGIANAVTAHENTALTVRQPETARESTGDAGAYAYANADSASYADAYDANDVAEVYDGYDAGAYAGYDANYDAGYEMGGYEGGSSGESSGDAWAGTCGPNADYNEQLVCSGVPASMLP
ncbi:MAG: hypothetical protein ACAI44_08175 [Candidatus Sericytochromatia bacterium]